MKLLLTSNGLKGELVHVFSSLLTKPASEYKVAFDITAAYGEEENPVWFEKFRHQLREQGITDIEDLDLRNKSEDEVHNFLATKDMLFVNGGNTFFLLEYMRKTNFKNALQEFLARDTIYIGVSAGAIVLGPTIAIAGVEPGDPNIVGMTDFTGLGTVDFEVSPHVPDMVSYESIEQYSHTTPHKIYSFDDYCGVLVQNGETKIVGNGKSRVYNS